MTRSTAFQSGHEPLQDDDTLQLKHSKVNGPFAFLNPTEAHFSHNHALQGGPNNKSSSDEDNIPENVPAAEEGQPASNIAFKWTARNNRKGRHAIVVKPSAANDAKYDTPLPTSHWRTILSTCWKMLVYYPVWDISWWVAYVFTWGSVVWVFNAFFVFLPLTNPNTEFDNEESVGGGVTAFIGATIFVFGSVLLMIEAVNSNKSGCFGWAVERVYEETMGHGTGQTASNVAADAEKGTVLRVRPAKEMCRHHHQNKKNLVGKAQVSAREQAGDDKSATTSTSSDGWQWYPSSHDLRTHYIYDLGFLACSFQMAGASIFWISGFTALPGVLNKLSPVAETWAYWFPQVLGGSGFIISGILFMIETQQKWWKPALSVLGWWIGLFNLIGGIGFTLCPAFGFNSASWAQYQASCSTFWGSFAFLIGSLVQLYESLGKNPVEVEKEE